MDGKLSIRAGTLSRSAWLSASLNYLGCTRTAQHGRSRNGRNDCGRTSGGVFWFTTDCESRLVTGTAKSSSSIIFGRPRSITHPNAVPLPPTPNADAPSKAAFIAKCELALLLDDLSPDASSCHCHPTSTRISRLTNTGSRLDQWSSAVAHRGLFSSSAPGVRSLQLLALGARLILVRSMWDAVNETNIDPTAARQACLTVCHEVVDFVEALSPSDLNGYWSSRRS
jgi:hypothetical protein